MSNIAETLWTNRTQASRRKAHCQIIVNGQDVTARIDPHLISVIVIDKFGEGFDTCTIELDDRDGRLIIPPDDAIVHVSLGWHTESLYLVFIGRVESVESGFGRKHGGRRLWIDSVGGDVKGKGFTPMQLSMGDGAPPGKFEGEKIPFSKFISWFADQTGHFISVSPQIGKIERDYWAANESFFHYGNRMAEELGGVFKVNGKNATFVDALSFQNAQGQTMGEIKAVWGDNLIDWRIKPYAARPQWDGAESDFYRFDLAKWDNINQKFQAEFPYGGAKGIAKLPNSAPNASVGQQTNHGIDEHTKGRRGTGWVTINGEPQALAGKMLTIVGAREGVDGTYSIDEAHHHYSRDGYVTRCKLQWPELASQPSYQSAYDELKRKMSAQPAPSGAQPETGGSVGEVGGGGGGGGGSGF